MVKHFLSLSKATLIIYLSFFLILNYPYNSSAAPVEAGKKEIRVALLDFKGISISKNDSIVITNIFREELFKTDRFQLLDKNLVDEHLKTFNYQEANMCDVECAINIGENLDCDKVITGDVSLLGDLYIINVRMVDVESQSLEVSELFRKKCQLENLVDEMAILVDGFLAKYDKIAASQTVAGEKLPVSSVQPAEMVATETITKESEPVEVVKNGKVIVKTIPDGAVVTANDKFLGISPFDPKELTPGKYAFAAKKKGYTDAGMEIEILSEKTTELFLSLKPIQVVASPEAEKPEEEEGGGTIWIILGGIAVVGVVAALLLSGGDEEPAPTTGTLAINNNTSSSVQVEIDGSSKGTISAGSSQSYELSIGTHTVKLTSIDTTGTRLGSSNEIITSPDPVPDSLRPGSRIKTTRSIRTNDVRSTRTINNLKAYSKTYTVNITGGLTETINHGNDWDNGDLSVTSNPSGASIWLDGTDTGSTTPSRIDEVSPGSHTVTCKKQGYNEGSKTVTVTAGRTESVHIDLTGQSGSLYVTSNPTGAEVWLDGTNTNKTTPAQIDGVTAGKHTVTCKMTGYSDVSKVVTVESGQTTNVHIDMTQQTGSISVTSNPTGSSIWLDGTNTSKNTPSTLENVPVGNHTITCKLTGCQDKSQAVTVTSGQTTNVFIDLIQKTGNISVSSNPTGASIWLDGTSTGKTTPSTLTNVSAGNHTVTCKLTGYQDKSQTVTVTSGQTTNVNLTLTPISNWVTIPAGCFDMGDHFSEGGINELPVHNVCISSFKINKYEVTNAEYKQCVDAGICTAPRTSSSNSRTSYYGNPIFDDYPVIFMDYSQAKTYCNWQSGRLPTEAEWEYAARGGLAGKRYPWGDADATCSRANYVGCVGDTSKVGSYSANGYGLYDMAGNVFEWVKDWLDSSYYSVSPTNDPQGPSSGIQRVLRGGSWFSDSYVIRVACRAGGSPASQDYRVGFRCAR